MINRFSKGNRKLSKNVLIWNLPRLKTCPGAGDCKKWCYEIKIERMYKQTVPFREINLELSKKSNFVDEVLNFLSKRKEKYVRIHESGDFYNQRYLDKWKEIARNSPDKIFYAFTKSLHLDLWSNLPDNMQILQSTGGKFDHKIDWQRATNRAKLHDEEVKTNEIVCPGSGCGEKCIICMIPGPIHMVGNIHL